MNTTFKSLDNCLDKVYARVMVSGYFDPIQPGHIDYFKYAKMGAYLKDSRTPWVIAVIHTPEDIIKKRGFYIYTVEELSKILLGFECFIDEVHLAEDTDGKVAKTIRKIRPEFFVKGPDRNAQNMPLEELQACKDVDCTIIYQPGIKKNSSSNIKNRIREQFNSFKE